MCGIVGASSSRNIVPDLLGGLLRLEYRGYDSAGIAVIANNQQLLRVRTVGKVNQLEQMVKKQGLEGVVGIAHTRWATHGKPTEINAHPHMAGDEVAIVHNGIIENHQELRAFLEEKGCLITSQTDSELIAHLIFLNLKAQQNLLSAVKNMVKKLKGAYAIGVICKSEPNHLIAIRSGSPLVIGIGQHENFIASDLYALLPLTDQFIYLQENDIADISASRIQIYDGNDREVVREIHRFNANLEMANKAGFKHYMLKEIFEQPEAISATLNGRISNDKVIITEFGNEAAAIFSKLKRVTIVACGTSYHAGLIASYWLEEIANIPCRVEIASENRYRSRVIEPNTLFVTISQSGETADTLAALRIAKQNGHFSTLSICNVAQSSIVRESDLVFLTKAGVEIGVASTKAFVTQLVALFLLTLSIGRFHGLSSEKEKNFVILLKELPGIIQNILSLDKIIEDCAVHIASKANALFIGRGLQYPIAMEGALKLKEIAYIHAESYPAGELKHGPIALIDENIPTIVLAPDEVLIEKIQSTIEELKARNGSLVVFTNHKDKIKSDEQTCVINLPAIDRLLSPIMFTVPLQLLAYYAAVIRGNDVDQPRNLAKSVTVE